MKYLLRHFVYAILLSVAIVFWLWLVQQPEDFAVWIKSSLTAALNGYIFQTVKYFVLAGLLFVLINIIFSERMSRRKIQPKQKFSRDQLIRESVFSLNCLISVAAVGLVLSWLNQTGLITIYMNPLERGVPYLIFNLVVLFVLVDTWFYWTHRLMHHPKIYMKFHHVHHVTRNPTTFTTFQLSPIETIFSATFLVTFLIIFDTPFLNIAIFSLLGLLRQLVGHCGYELFPRITLTNRVLKHSTTVTHHELHHKYVSCNYGLYFSWWDSAMRTMHPKYEQEFEAATKRKHA